MAVCKKGKRKIICNSKQYFWYVAKDKEFGELFMLLRIYSEDKKFNLIYPVGANYVICEGRIFQGSENHCSGRYFLPCDMTECITPKFVSDIVHWANGESKAVRLTDRKQTEFLNPNHIIHYFY